MNKKQFSLYQFADTESKENALEALACVREGRGRAFVVVGPPATGKSHFIRECLAVKYADCEVITLPHTEKQMSQEMERSKARGYLWIDQVSGPIKSVGLASAIRTRAYPTLVVGDGAPRLEENKIIFFFSGCLMRLPVDLARRVKVIRFAEKRMPEKREKEAAKFVTFA